MLTVQIKRGLLDWPKASIILAPAIGTLVKEKIRVRKKRRLMMFLSLSEKVLMPTKKLLWRALPGFKLVKEQFRARPLGKIYYRNMVSFLRFSYHHLVFAYSYLCICISDTWDQCFCVACTIHMYGPKGPVQWARIRKRWGGGAMSIVNFALMDFLILWY